MLEFILNLEKSFVYLLGFIYEKQLRVKSFYGDDEKQLLTEFANMISSWDRFGNKQICGHNIKEFDVPYIARRMLVNGLNTSCF